MNVPPNLCYTIALDKSGQDVHRRMARLLVTSLLRTGWHGRIVVFRNGGRAVLPEGHKDVEEIVLEADPEPGWLTMTWKFRVRDLLDLRGIGKVLFLDCDCLALRDINHLMFGRWDIYTAPEPGRLVEPPFNGYLTEGEMKIFGDRPGLNSGCFGIRAEHYRKVMAEWERVLASEPLRPSKCREQHAWNRVVLDALLRQREFAAGELQFPFLHHAPYLAYRQAALIHAADRTAGEKLSLLYGLWMESFGRAFLSCDQGAAVNVLPAD